MLWLAPLSLSLPGHFIFIIAGPPYRYHCQASCHIARKANETFLPFRNLLWVAPFLATDPVTHFALPQKLHSRKSFCLHSLLPATLETQCFKIHFNQSSSSLHKRVNKYLSVLCWNVKHDPLEVLTTYCLCQNLCHWKLLHDSCTSTHWSFWMREKESYKR